MSEEVPVFETKGSRSGTVGTWITVLGVIGGLTAMIMTIALAAAGQHHGWLWVGASVLFLAAMLVFGWWSFKRDDAKIALLLGPDGLVVRISGAAFDQRFSVAKFDYWYCFERMPMKQGGAILVKYYATLQGANGETVGFKQMRGGKGTEPADWPMREKNLSEGRGVFHIMDLQGFIRRLAAR